VIAPDYHPESFVDFLSLCATMEEDILPEYPELQQSVQIAPFHPLFEFADSNGVDVWTNRSPYPILHILREQDVSIAVEKLQGDASKVWGRNIKLLRDLEVALGGAEEGVGTSCAEFQSRSGTHCTRCIEKISVEHFSLKR
jgi:hypothetical protein